MAARILRSYTVLYPALVVALADDEAVSRLHAVLEQFAVDGCTFANLRTRTAGALQFAQVDLRVPADWSVRRAHDLADALERAVAECGISLTTHIEPVASATPGGAEPHS